MARKVQATRADWATVPDQQQITCWACGRLVAYGSLPLTPIYVKCHRQTCGAMNQVGGEQVQEQAA